MDEIKNINSIGTPIKRSRNSETLIVESPERSLAVKAILSLKNALAEKNELNPSKKVKTEIDESDETYEFFGTPPINNNTKSKTPGTYSRKEKSLTILCDHFIEKCMNTKTTTDIYITQIAKELNVERRRIYDVVNVCESLGIVERQAKNKYKFNNVEKISNSLSQIQNDDFELMNDKRANSLGYLCKKFVRLFTKVKKEFSFDDLIELLLMNEMENKFKCMVYYYTLARVRRIYDIINILLSLGLLERKHYNRKKCIYRWTNKIKLFNSVSILPFVDFESHIVYPSSPETHCKSVDSNDYPSPSLLCNLKKIC